MDHSDEHWLSQGGRGGLGSRQACSLMLLTAVLIGCCVALAPAGLFLRCASGVRLVSLNERQV